MRKMIALVLVFWAPGALAQTSSDDALANDQVEIGQLLVTLGHMRLELNKTQKDLAATKARLEELTKPQTPKDEGGSTNAPRAAPK